MNAADYTTVNHYLYNHFFLFVVGKRLRKGLLCKYLCDPEKLVLLTVKLGFCGQLVSCRYFSSMKNVLDSSHQRSAVRDYIQLQHCVFLCLIRHPFSSMLYSLENLKVPVMVFSGWFCTLRTGLMSLFGMESTS